MSQDLLLVTSVTQLPRVLSVEPVFTAAVDIPVPLPLETSEAPAFLLELSTIPLPSLLDTTIEAELDLVTTTQPIVLQTSIEGEP